VEEQRELEILKEISMDSKKTIQAILDHKIIAIVRGIAGERIVQTAKALRAGGIRLVEVTFNQSSASGLQDTANAISSLCELFGDDMFIGAGTVMSEEQLSAAHAAGAKYVISPHMDVKLIANTKKRGLVSIPGCFTPSEIVAAHAAGADFVKLFPAGIMGVPYIKAIRAPISHIPLLVVGGVDESNMNDFMAAGVAGFGIGSNIVKESMINAGRFD
jgi:2-dehydro-3-deoxyphosphogluconate aldolase / (4S)-4-hydroxy-2-oxoglutarate aldolase